MTILLHPKEEENYYAFIKELESISKKYGIGLSAKNCFVYWLDFGFKDIKYKKDPTSGHLEIEKIIFSDGDCAEIPMIYNKMISNKEKLLNNLKNKSAIDIKESFIDMIENFVTENEISMSNNKNSEINFCIENCFFTN